MDNQYPLTVPCVIASCPEYDHWAHYAALAMLQHGPHVERMHISSVPRSRPFGAQLLDLADEYDRPFCLLMADYIVTEHDLELWRIAVGLAGERDVGCVRLYPCPGPDADPSAEAWGTVSPSAPYSISLQASIWSPDFLRHLVCRQWSPWDVEIRGTGWYNTAGALAGKWRVLSLKKTALSYMNASRRGIDQPEAIEYVKSL